MSNVKQYRKKPVVIEAIEWDGSRDAWLAIEKWAFAYVDKLDSNLHNQTIQIPTLEGEMTANKGDYIIKGVANEIYPCKPDIFAATYEEVV